MKLTRVATVNYPLLTLPRAVARRAKVNFFNDGGRDARQLERPGVCKLGAEGKRCASVRYAPGT